MATWTALKTWNFSSPRGVWAFDGIGNEADGATFDSVHSTSTRYIFNNADGTQTIVNGSGLAGGSDFSWTSLTSVQHLASDGSLIEQITGITETSASAPVGHFFSGILDGADTFTGSSGADQFRGHDGDNVVLGGGGADELHTGSGNDTFRLQAGDFVSGETIDAGGGFNTIQLENTGNIDLRVGSISGVQELHYYSGTSIVTSGSPAFTTIVGSSGVDQLIIAGAIGFDLSGLTFSSWTTGQDTITYVDINGGIKGTSQNETYQLTRDVGGIQGGGGDDTFVLTGTAFHGGIAFDGGTGTNVIQLNSATVDYSADPGNALTNIQQIQYISGNSSFTVSGTTLAGAMPQTIVGSAGVDTFVVNTAGVQTDLSGITFNSWTDGTDTITIDGRGGGPTDIDITGSSHNDTIYSYNGGHESINGGGGNDVIVVGHGTDTLTGGAGADTFVFTTVAYAPIDVVTDFTVSGGNHDRIDLSALGAFHSLSSVLAAATQTGNDTVIDIGPDSSIILQNVSKNSLTSADFVLGTFQDSSLALAAFGASSAAGGWSSDDIFHRTLADVNGDGRADIIGFGYSSTVVALANSSGGFDAPITGVNSFGYSPAGGSWSTDTQDHRTAADVNGDGMADLVGFGYGGTYVALATGGGHFANPTLTSTTFGSSAAAGGWSDNNLYHREVADVNGDGMADIVGFGYDGTYVALATGGGNFATASLASTTFGSSATAGGWSDDNIYHRELADVNGDGMADIVGFGSDTTYVALATGGGHFAAAIAGIAGFGSSTAGGSWSNQTTYTRHLADINGDGRADIVGFGYSGTIIAYGNANGTFQPAQTDVAAFGASTAAGGWYNNELYPRLLGDVDGGGAADIVGFGYNGTSVAHSNFNWVG